MSRGVMSRTGAWLRELLRDRRGQGDLMTSLLLTAAGAVMVGVTVPSLFESSESAARTFQKQVDVLERGASPRGGGGGIGIGIGGWDINIGSGGISVSGRGGSGFGGSVSVGSGGVSGSVSGGGGFNGGGSGNMGGFAPGAGVSLGGGGGSLSGGAGNPVADAILNPNGP